MEQRWNEAELRAALDEYEDQLRKSGKARNTVATYVQHSERFINWLAGSYDTGAPQPRGEARSRYDPLRRFLESSTDDEVSMTFRQVEQVLGGPLPVSARRHRPWWANEQSGTHTHARSWMGAGRKTRAVDLNAETVVFGR